MKYSYWKKCALLLLTIPILEQLSAQNVEVDVNVNIKHEVGGVSDFGRERHITLHAALSESDWAGEEEKMEYLLNDLDVYLGRDNGSSTWKFQYSAEDPDNRSHHDPDSLSSFAGWWLEEYENIIETNGTKQYENRSTGKICGTNPHPTYPTLSYWHMCGSEWGRANGYAWLPQDIETSADWVTQYLDEFFVDDLASEGELMPEYWEVINEPDMLMNTGAFMVTSWEDIWEYHNLVAEGVRNRLGNRAPKIGGMTWGLHDFFADDLHRSRTVGYSDAYYGNTPGDEIAKAYAREQTESAYLNQTGPWTQWDVLWKGFMDNAGDNMDFYSVHMYDWPTYGSSGGATRSGGHVEAMLEMIEWYDVTKNGVNNRKPLVISEYGAVQGAWTYLPHDARYDWESLKPFNAMMMQFLERPDYIEKTMPFTPIKAQWGDVDQNGDGTPEYVYQYKMMRDDDHDGNWEWSDYIKWFELWAEVKGTRVDTKSSDPDIQVDSYVDGRDMYLILNNLEGVAKSINLNMFGNRPTLQNVNTKHLYLQGTSTVKLDDTNASSAPSAVQLAADGTMILKYTYANNVTINQQSVEKKFYGEAVSSNERVDIQSGMNTFYVNDVAVPQDASKAEAMLRITVNLFDAEDDQVGFLSIDELRVNGVAVEAPLDWRGGSQNRSRWFGTLEIPVPVNLLQANNQIDVDFHHSGEVCVVNLSTWEFTTAPGRTIGTDPGPSVAVTGVSVSPTQATLTSVGATQALTATVAPTNATNKSVNWSSSNSNVATVNANGVVTAVANGTATITATTVDGAKIATSQVTVSTSSQMIAVTGVSVSPTSLSLNVGQSTDLSETVSPANASNKAVSWASSNTNVATVNANGSVSAVGVGNATVTVTTADGNKTATAAVTVSAGTPSGTTIVIEAESFASTGGTYNDGHVPNGVNVAPGLGINYVNAGDWAEYSINVGEAGVYSIVYQISTPMTNAQIQIAIDGNNVSTDNVANNGQWDSYQGLTASNNATLTAGVHTVRITASGTNAWQWNLDKITLTKVGELPGTGEGNPVSLTIQAEDFATTGGTYSGFLTYTVGSVMAINYNQTGDWADYNVNIPETGDYNVEYFMGTTVNGAAVELSVDGVAQRTDAVPSNGNWDAYASVVAGGTIHLSAGSNTIRLKGAGTHGWEWNMDRFILSKGGASARTASSSDNLEIPVTMYPVPADNLLHFRGLVKDSYQFVLFDIRGKQVMNAQLNRQDGYQLSVSDLQSGLYLIRIQSGAESKSLKVVITH
ncbi:Por secretion system C-terminal sorting domain-containing protein [Reichenbachiella agariperforans]|uniref:Por secretion system C-terminal sorting domain-containing protein n=1 Tax=Reichenbachiella agariperforans TaxID=156994 RepID=A0A1M6UL32_REIAG|nr:Ig-like domain-containing protein [Reichenbachiella agariperforans]SHK69896.1 Por secretion system C-terminal sorting domain-containing protein [Reichenbachiella agariperforans]